jgi:cobalt-zinc-cadmium resistance protein CzcA
VVQAGIGGSSVSTLIDGTKRFDIAVRLSDEFRLDPAAIGAIPIRSGEGALVPFSQVASIELDEGYSFVRRDRCSGIPCCRWTSRGATWTASSRMPTR